MIIRENHGLDLGLNRLAIAALVLILTACGSVAPPETPPSSNGSSRYSMVYDSPELEPIDLNSVQAVIPVAEPRTRAGNMSPYTINGKTYRVLPTEAGYRETGMASWYGRKFHGHLTSNGEVYDMFELSAAHKTLPIPSYVRVTNLDNGRSLVVRVNDRGPFHDGRIVDLSYAAAMMLDYAHSGTALVEVEAIVPGQAAPDVRGSEPGMGQEYLQVGAFSSMESAQNLLASLSSLTNLPVFIHSDGLHRVRLGPLNEAIEVQSVIRRIIDAGLGTPFKIRQ